MAGFAMVQRNTSMNSVNGVRVAINLLELEWARDFHGGTPDSNRFRRL